MTTTRFCLVLSLGLLACNKADQPSTMQTTTMPPATTMPPTTMMPPAPPRPTTTEPTFGPPVLGGGTTCDLVNKASTSAIESSASGAVNCGVATMNDDTTVWKTLNDCIVENLGAKRSFFGAFELDNSGDPDSVRGIAYVGIAGDPFQLEQVIWDSDPSGGYMTVPPRAQSHDCVDYGLARPECMVHPGVICVGCWDNSIPDAKDICPGSWEPPPLPEDNLD